MIILLALAGCAFGRIGETLDQCKQRYVYSKKEGVMHRFTKDGFNIVAIFDANGKCCYISYGKLDRTKIYPERWPGVELPEIQLKAFLKANAAGVEWKEFDDAANAVVRRVWANRGRGGLIAVLLRNNKLMIQTKAYFDEHVDPDLGGF